MILTHRKTAGRGAILPPSAYPAFDITGISHDTGVEIGADRLPTLSRWTIVVDYRDNLMLFEAPALKK